MIIILRASPRAAGPLALRGKKRGIIALVVLVMGVVYYYYFCCCCVVFYVSGRLWEAQLVVFYTLRAGPPTQLSLVRVSF